ncbi:MAG: FAD-binding and (Fe-S)-binding domain-containing protein, partial [Steroidobacteraceae bacterium]
VETGAATTAEAEAEARSVVTAMRPYGLTEAIVESDPARMRALWRIREDGAGLLTRSPDGGEAWPGWEDAAVPVDALGAYLREFRALLNRHGYHGSLYGHFGGGCVHVSIDFDLASADGIRNYREFVEQAADLVVRHRGSFSGEHGDGQARGELLVKMFGPELVQAMREFKAIWDPANRMNPGKVVDPYPIVANLRLGPGWPRADPPVSFSYPRDAGSFARSSIRCVGIGECRRLRGGVMCPSFMATREEKHSTRGRARLLFEMLHGDPLADGWRSEAVRDALDLCLACKGCKRDCPVDVDMATYKAEFFSHYYAGRLRPRAAYSMGLIRTWCRAAQAAPGLADFLLRTPPFNGLLKAAGGVHRERRLPPFARRTFRDWHRRHRAPERGDEVLLFPDTFSNHFHPDVAVAATRVLEAAGCRVGIPPRPLCCARPLYAWGMLDRARKQLAQILDALDAAVQAGTPVIALEPACCASLRDELPDLFPRDERAKRLAASTHTLGEFLGRRKGYEPPRLSAPALVQVHCHQHAVLGFEHESALLRRLGLDVEVLDSGCCGMAGGFGFETEHYEVSMKCAERVLLPRVREASAETLVIADGFSCREQIAQGAHRRALHLAEVLEQAHRDSAKGGVT